MTQSSKKMSGRVFLTLFACGSIYFSYVQLHNSARVQQTVSSVVAKISGEKEIVSNLLDHNDVSILALDVVRATNQARLDVEPNLAPLIVNSELTRSAEAKVADMIEKNYFEHETPEGYNVEHFVDDAGYEYITVADNLASGDFVDAEALVVAWMNSPGHRANILNHDVSEIGIAVSYAEFQGRAQYVAVQHFGRPRSACPGTDELLNSAIHDNEAELESIELELKELKTAIDSETPDSGEYEAHINQYNELVSSYNALSTKIKKDIETYNAGVRAFNTCIGATESH